VVLPAQSTASTEAPHHVVVGSSDEDYLREITTGVTMVREFNRDLQAGAWDVNLLVGFQLRSMRALK
jgi:hypothetical protein